MYLFVCWCIDLLSYSFVLIQTKVFFFKGDRSFSRQGFQCWERGVKTGDKSQPPCFALSLKSRVDSWFWVAAHKAWVHEHVFSFHPRERNSNTHTDTHPSTCWVMRVYGSKGFRVVRFSAGSHPMLFGFSETDSLPKKWKKKRTTPRKCVLCNWSSIFIQSWPRKISRNHPEPLAQPASHRPRALGRGSCPWCAWEYCLTRRSLESNVMSSYGTFIFLHCLQRRRYQIDMFTVYIDLKISEDSQMCPCV